MSMAAATRSQQWMEKYRWWILVAAIIAQIPNANLQYAWTLFPTHMVKDGFGKLSRVQEVFALFVLLETWLVPVEGWLVDRIGPRTLTMVGGALIGIAWVMSAQVKTLGGLLFWYGVVGGIGGGIIYGATIATALKWFPDRRGLTAGLVAAGFGAGAALSVAPIENVINHAGWRAAFLQFGILQGVVVILAALFLQAPPESFKVAEIVKKVSRNVRQAAVDSTPGQMLRTPHFWVMYIMMVLVGGGGLMATAQLGPIAKSAGVDQVKLLWGLTALVLALQIDRVLNGITRPIWGWISDRIGRENAMFIAFGLQGFAILWLLSLLKNPVGFVVASGAAFFFWGEMYSLFPATVGDLYGRKYAATNYGLMYTAKGVASIWAGPVAAMMFEAQRSWTTVFYLAAAANFVAAAMAWGILKRMATPQQGPAPRMAAVATGGE
ncbi:MAG TPA: oxalate/formate MFS antiporter [bacterium]|nr:oxalate/formate MFS antiporter [bacterium]